MAGHARLKDEFTEDEKYHNLMRWLIYHFKGVLNFSLVFTEIPLFNANSVEPDQMMSLTKSLLWDLFLPGIPLSVKR